MRRVTTVGLTVVAALLTASCATIIKGSTQTITVSSNVDGASVLLDGERIGTTPFTGVVKRNKAMLTVQKEGYRPSTVALTKSLEPIFWGNIITGGTFGSITDFASGAAYQYAPASYQVDLQAGAQSSSDFEHRVAARKFAMVYLDEISIDLASGGGDYLSALVAIINGDGPARVDGAAVRDALQASGGHPISFGRRIVELI